MPTFAEMVKDAQGSLAVKRVFGEPYEKNGITIIPAARIMGGIGGGEGAPIPGHDETAPATPSGIGGGYGIVGAPAGAYVIKGDKVAWLPAVDVNRMMLGFQVVMVMFFLAIRTIVKTRAKTAAAKR